MSQDLGQNHWPCLCVQSTSLAEHHDSKDFVLFVIKFLGRELPRLLLVKTLYSF